MHRNSSPPSRAWSLRAKFIAMLWTIVVPEWTIAQNIGDPWSSHGHDPQHTGISRFPSQPMNRIIWQTPVDLDRQYSGTLLLAHYGSPLVTRANTVVLPVKTGATDGFRVEARRSTDGTLIWMRDTDYSAVPTGWIAPCGIGLSPKNRVWIPGAGGTVYWRDNADSAAGATGQVAFYGMANYEADKARFNSRVKINTPLTVDRYGNVYFGFVVFGSTTPPLSGGIARIDVNGTGSWVSATTAGADSAFTQAAGNCAPALSNDQRTVYIAFNSGGSSRGVLAALDSRSLAPLNRVALKDVKFPNNNASLPDNGTSCPAVGPDGDVYFGVFENPFPHNHDRGWMLHFDKTLTQTKTPGAFGWDVTPSIVPRECVPSYTGSSDYLLLTKYNNYAGLGGDGVNKVALLDPNATMTDPITGATVMKEVMTIDGPTPDEDFPGFPGAVREWCINAVTIDIAKKSALTHSEDGKVYRWDFTTNTLIEPLVLTAGIGEAYTPTVSGPDGTIYIIANGILFAIGQ
ncbi:MAG TPA: hypothetical protein VG796_14945 [Verrucomicrobiales bacterium]|nr:hypothetical protein [Verrucomicrobiales bacterium]